MIKTPPKILKILRENRSSEEILKEKRRKIGRNLRVRVFLALKKYTKTGKIWSSKQYEIDYKAIIEHLNPFPEDRSKYHIDHIRPLCSFDLTKPEEVRLAFAPENHQWLLAEENLKKNKKFNLLDFKREENKILI